MPMVAKLDELGKPAWIALTILGFVIWWPIGLATLAFIIGSGRMSCWKGGGMSRWHGAADQMRHAGTWWPPSRSGNRAFDEYRQDTLQRLEEEQREFQDFLARLRMAKDKAEFEQFRAERRPAPERRAPARRRRTDVLRIRDCFGPSPLRWAARFAWPSRQPAAVADLWQIDAVDVFGPSSTPVPRDNRALTQSAQLTLGARGLAP